MKHIKYTIFGALLITSQLVVGQDNEAEASAGEAEVKATSQSNPLKVEWKGGQVMIEQQTRLIRANQNDLIKSLNSVVSEIQKSNENLEKTLSTINQQQGSLKQQLSQLSSQLDETSLKVQSNAEQSAENLIKAVNKIGDSIKGLESGLASNQKKVQRLQENHSGLLTKLGENTTKANAGVEENKKLLLGVRSNNNEIENKIANLETEINTIETKRKEDHQSVKSTLGEINSEMTLSFILKTFVIIAAIGLGFFVWKNKRMITEVLSGGAKEDTNQIETIFTDERYIEGLNRAINLLGATQQKNSESAKDVDHGLPLSVADEINRMRIRLEKMQGEDIKVKPLQKALERMEEKLQDMGYEIVDLTNEPYVEGMTAKPTLIPDDSLSGNQAIITKVISPLVNYQGKILQVPEIEVSVGG